MKKAYKDINLVNFLNDIEIVEKKGNNILLLINEEKLSNYVDVDRFLENGYKKKKPRKKKSDDMKSIEKYIFPVFEKKEIFKIVEEVSDYDELKKYSLKELKGMCKSLSKFVSTSNLTKKKAIDFITDYIYREKRMDRFLK